MKKEKKIAIWTIAVFIAYLISFGPMEFLACKISGQGFPSRIAHMYFKASGIINYPHYKFASMNRLYFRYYVNCYEMGTGKPFFTNHDSYKENFCLGTSPSAVSLHVDFTLLPSPDDKNSTILPDPDRGSRKDFMKFS